MKLFSRSRRNNHRLRRQRRLLFEPLCHRTLLAVDLVPGSSSASFVDMGFNPDTGEVVLVGTEDSGVAKVFKLNAARTAISSETLVGLGLDTQVLGISSDGTRIAGVSKSPESVDVGEGTTWLSSAPDSPVGIGFVSGKPKTSTAFGARNGGVVGDYNGLDGAHKWTPIAGIQILAGDPAHLQGAEDVVADGTVQVGFSNLGSSGSKAVYWDTENIHPLVACS